MKKHLADLDGMRGIGALLVAMEHMTGAMGVHFFPSGHLRVDFFFAMSGFVLPLAYDEKLKDGRMTFGSFILARIRRLHPLLILGLALGGVVYVAKFGADTETFMSLASLLLLGILLVPNSTVIGPAYAGAQPLNGPLWTLLSEYVVSFFYAAIFKHLTKFVLATIILAGFFLSICTLYLFGTLDVGFKHDDWWWGIARAIYPFFMGVALYRLWRRGIPTVVIPFPLLAVFFVAPLALTAGPLSEALILLFCFPLLLLACTTSSEFKSSGAKYFLGYLSYPVYVVHYPIVRAFSSQIRAFELQGVEMAAAFVVQYCIILLVAYIAAKFWDAPVQRFLARKRHVRPVAAG